MKKHSGDKMNRQVMIDYKVEELFPKTFCVILKDNSEPEFIGSLSDCLAWLELKRLEITVTRI